METVGTTVVNITTMYGDRWLIDLSWCSLCKVYKYWITKLYYKSSVMLYVNYNLNFFLNFKWTADSSNNSFQYLSVL